MAPTRVEGFYLGVNILTAVNHRERYMWRPKSAIIHVSSQIHGFWQAVEMTSTSLVIIHIAPIPTRLPTDELLSNLSSNAHPS
ncbi:hypothetical protein EDD18DRAFT_1357210 [Armillaria luteobubalina]|uniref:Uncharacterized protein n=1 Tax=Armillaria luteobubalina TaxID=153913 RepID=A0AA39PZE6_9AGAR|nr:hypothetical protein EDD18DRAFT_1357210 [Armillaria luteobubalina]